LLGENVIGWGSHFFCKMPGDGKSVSWHQDASYWPLTPSKAVTVWLAIDDADVGNACMRFIPGSHWFGHLTYRMTGGAGGRGVAGRRVLGPLGPAAARLGGEHVGPPPLRADAALLRGGRAGLRG